MQMMMTVMMIIIIVGRTMKVEKFPSAPCAREIFEYIEFFTFFFWLLLMSCFLFIIGASSKKSLSIDCIAGRVS